MPLFPLPVRIPLRLRVGAVARGARLHARSSHAAAGAGRGGGDHLVSRSAVGHDAAVLAGFAFGVLEGFLDGVGGLAFAFEVFGEVFLFGERERRVG